MAKKMSKSKSAPKSKSRSKSSPRSKSVQKPTSAMIVTLSGDRAIHQVTRDLKAAGFTVKQVLEPSGIVTGHADDKNAAKLRRVRGVADVSPDHPVSIGPPNAEVS